MGIHNLGYEITDDHQDNNVEEMIHYLSVHQLK